MINLKITNLDEFLQKVDRKKLLSKDEEHQLLKAVHEKGPDCEKTGETDELQSKVYHRIVGTVSEPRHIQLT